ncbi:hypothetical protein [Nocardia sp. NBC_00403]|uniref:hypothetical protein n=1 Tax=Nocardia sp. NBC_00403 TaxID=2975990 RepID=UPI002E1FC25A
MVAGGLIALGAAAALADIGVGYLFVMLPEIRFSAIVSELLGFLLTLGGILLLRRSAAGRVLVILGGILALVTLGFSVALFQFLGPLPAVGMSLMLTTVTLAAVTPTGRWIAAGSQPGTQPPASAYGQPPAYGQPAAYGQSPAYPQPLPSHHQPAPQPYGQPPAYGQPAPLYSQAGAGQGLPAASLYGQPPQHPYPQTPGYDQPPSQ